MGMVSTVGRQTDMHTYETHLTVDGGLFIDSFHRAESEEDALGQLFDDLCRAFPIDGAWLRANSHRFSAWADVAMCDSCGHEVPLAGGCPCLTNESCGIYP